jgi:hypothetical protein
MVTRRTAGLNQLGPKRSVVPFVSPKFNYVKRKPFSISKEDVDGVNAFRARHGIALLGHRDKRPPVLRLFRKSRKPVTLPKVTKFDGNG